MIFTGIVYESLIAFHTICNEFDKYFYWFPKDLMELLIDFHRTSIGYPKDLVINIIDIRTISKGFGQKLIDLHRISKGSDKKFSWYAKGFKTIWSKHHWFPQDSWRIWCGCQLILKRFDKELDRFPKDSVKLSIDSWKFLNGFGGDFKY